MRKLLSCVLAAGMVAGLTTPAFAADNDNKKDPAPVAGDYPSTVGPDTANRDAVRIIEKRLGRKANGVWGPELTRELAEFQKRRDALVKDRKVGRRTLAVLRGREKLPPRGPLTDAQAWWLGLEPRAEREPAPEAPATDTVAEEDTAPAPAPAPAESSGSTGTGTGGTLDQIRACESGGDYGAVDSSGTYGGAYQFDQSTWESVGGSGSPSAASPAEQDQRAQMLLEQSGTSPWPVCGG